MFISEFRVIKFHPELRMRMKIYLLSYKLSMTRCHPEFKLEIHVYLTENEGLLMGLSNKWSSKV